MIRGGVALAVMVAATGLPYSITVDWTQPVTPMPPVSAALFIASSALLAAAGCMLRHRDARGAASIAPQV